MNRRQLGMLGLILTLLTPSCREAADDAASDRVDPRCAFPAAADTVRTDGDAVLLVWTFPDDSVYAGFALPADSAYLAYRDAIRAAGAAVRNPSVDDSLPRIDAEAAVLRDEAANRDLAQRGAVGRIEPIRCLDALLFAYQHGRVSELTQPTEFVASVLSKVVDGHPHLTVLFGAGKELFPPKSVYGFDAAEGFVADGWRYRYVLHNHTVQRDGDRVALGAPALSTSDVQLMQSLATDIGLEYARVTNGFYTYTVETGLLDRLRSRE